MLMLSQSQNFKVRCLAAGSALLGLTALTGCHVDMWRQPKIHSAQRENPNFDDLVSTRPIVAGTVARGKVKDDPAYFDGTTPDGNNLITEIPARALNGFAGATDADKRLAMIRRGQDRFNIFCAPCHGKIGDGNGMIAQRGFSLRRPPGNYHTDRLRKMPIGHFYDVIVNGYGTMFPYASRIQSVNDRWAVAAYVRALQLSQNASLSDVPEGRRTDAETELTDPAASEAITRDAFIEGDNPDAERKSNSDDGTTAPPPAPVPPATEEGGTP
jgi:mono/diheme cytochrome c family protein